MNNYRFLSFKIFLYFCIILKQISIKDFISLLSQIILQILYFDFVMIRIYVNTYRFLSFKIFLYFCIILKQILDQRFYFLSQIILQILYFDFVMINLRVDKNRIQYLNFKYSISSCPFWNYLSRFLLSFFFFFFFFTIFPWTTRIPYWRNEYGHIGIDGSRRVCIVLNVRDERAPKYT